MAETPNERTREAVGDLAAAARDRGLDKLEGAKGQLAEGAERVAAAVERTADELEGEGDDTLSGFGRSAASLMRQLAGGIRERDVDAFARELGALARRNPGVFLAGSVALGFGIARFFKARIPHARFTDDYDRRSTGGWQDSSSSGVYGERNGVYSEENLDLSAGATSGDSGEQSAPEGETASPSGGASQAGSSYGGGAPVSSGTSQPSMSRDDDRGQSKTRQSGKQKAKPQRASSGGAERAGEGSNAPSADRPSTEPGGETAGTELPPPPRLGRVVNSGEHQQEHEPAETGLRHRVRRRQLCHADGI